MSEEFKNEISRSIIFAKALRTGDTSSKIYTNTKSLEIGHSIQPLIGTDFNHNTSANNCPFVDKSKAEFNLLDYELVPKVKHLIRTTSEFGFSYPIIMLLGCSLSSNHEKGKC